MKAQTDQEIDQAIASFTDLQKVIVLKALLKQRKGNAPDLDALMKDFEQIRWWVIEQLFNHDINNQEIKYE